LTDLLIVFGSSLGLALLLTPRCRALAARFGPVDRPDGRRKLHDKATPVAGGGAVLLSLAGALVVAHWTPGPANGWLAQGGLFLPGLLLASLVICVLGLLDDFRGLSARPKVLGQLIAVTIVMNTGLVVQRIRLFDWQVELGLFAVPFTALSLLGTINSLNLLDGMDGLLSCVGFIISLAVAAMALLGGQWMVACVAAALAGALLGFLRYNFPPASIFLGDSGSMLVGLIIGTVALRGSLKGPATVALVAPVALLGIPVFETLAAIIRRTLTGRSIYSGDRGHLHHCLLARGFSTQRALLWISVSCCCMAAGALGSVSFGNEWFAVITAGAVISVYVVGRLFGSAELMLVRDCLATGMIALLRSSQNGYARETEIHLQGSVDWRELWGKLTAQASDLDLKMIRLDVNAPAVYEGYHARWRGPANGSEAAGEWRAEIPLTVHGQPTGRLEAVGRRGPEPVSVQIATLMEFAESLEATVAKLGNGVEPAGPVTDSPAPDSTQPQSVESGWSIPEADLATNGQAVRHG
jgi:UDP-GlcNAc:undecaprenyl-phosphate GlcNAc-1-phosphate transferase